jgi:hypothetical protein
LTSPWRGRVFARTGGIGLLPGEIALLISNSFMRRCPGDLEAGGDGGDGAIEVLKAATIL